MKKTTAILLLISLLLCLSACDFADAAMFYTDSAEIDGLHIEINKIADRCFVSHYPVSEYTEGMTITIPDDYNGIPIKRIGGFVGSGAPCPFIIDLSELYMNAPEGSDYSGVYGDHPDRFNIADEYSVEEVLFQLHIGKNIEVVDFIMNDYYPHINEDGSITFYHPVVCITCSEDNTTFYSKDGKLYHRANDALVEDFAYPE